MAANKIEIRSLHKHFGHKKVLDGIDLDVKEGESLVVIGGKLRWWRSERRLAKWLAAAGSFVSRTTVRSVEFAAGATPFR